MFSTRGTAAPDDMYNTVWQQLFQIQKNWHTDREKAKAELKALLWNIESACAAFASTAWNYVVDSVKGVLAGTKQGIEDLVEYVIQNQEALKAVPAKTVGLVSTLWCAADEFCRAIRGESLDEDQDDLSVKPKLN